MQFVVVNSRNILLILAIALIITCLIPKLFETERISTQQLRLNINNTGNKTLEITKITINDKTYFTNITIEPKSSKTIYIFLVDKSGNKETITICSHDWNMSFDVIVP
jgi:hypothetical protein